jgi:GT2 family glycosyltransferase
MPVSVEVLIVSYNTRDITASCIESLRRWAPSTAEHTVSIAVIDNDSHDGSAELIAERFPEVRLLRSSENLGFGKANNRLAQTSTADYLLLLNSDTLLVEELLGPLLAQLTADPVRAIVGPRLEFPDGRLQWSSNEFPRLWFEVARTLRGSRIDRALRPVASLRDEIARVQQEALAVALTPRATASLWATCWLLRRADAEATGLFSSEFPIYDEDLDLCRRLFDAGRVVVYVPGTRLVHLGGSSSTTLASKLEFEHAARRRYYRRHVGLLTSTLFVGLKRLARVDWLRRVARISAY